MSEPMPATAVARAKRRVPRRLIVALTLLALLVAFEVGVRVIQPDTLTYTANVPTSWPDYQYEHRVITDPRAVAGWYAAVNAHPHPLFQVNVLSSIFIHCNGLIFADESYQFAFTWHGLPLETASTTETSCGPILWLTSGGLPSLRGYALPAALPTPTP